MGQSLEEMCRELGFHSNPTLMIRQAGLIAPLINLEHLEQIKTILAQNESIVIHGLIAVLASSSLSEAFFSNPDLCLALDDFLINTNPDSRGVCEGTRKRAVMLLYYVLPRMVQNDYSRLRHFMAGPRGNCHRARILVRITDERWDAIDLRWDSSYAVLANDVPPTIDNLIKVLRGEALSDDLIVVRGADTERNIRAHIAVTGQEILPAVD